MSDDCWEDDEHVLNVFEFIETIMLIASVPPRAKYGTCVGCFLCISLILTLPLPCFLSPADRSALPLPSQAFKSVVEGVLFNRLASIVRGDIVEAVHSDVRDFHAHMLCL